MAINQGYFIDAPNVLIRTKKGKTLPIVTAQSGEVIFDGESIDIQGGWSSYRLKNIDTTKSVTINVEDAQWKYSTMEMVTGGTTTEGTVDFEFYGDAYTVGSGNTITIGRVVKAGTVGIEGLEETTAETPTEGQFKVTINTENTTVLFHSSMAGKDVTPAYMAEVANGKELSVKTDDFPKTAKVVVTYPAYATEDDEDKTIAGYVQITIFRAKIQPSYTAGGSYKSAQALSISFQGEDPRREDKKMFDIKVIPA